MKETRQIHNTIHNRDALPLTHLSISHKIRVKMKKTEQREIQTKCHNIRFVYF